MMHIYVASSWRNTYYPDVVKALRDSGHDVYDFRNPPSGDPGFHWTDVDEHCADWTPAEYQANLSHPLAERQFKNDIEAMTSCDACVLVLPCGRSAHAEAGWFAGQGKKVYVLITDQDSFEPELMYKLFTKVCISLDELIEELKHTLGREEIEALLDTPILNAGFSTRVSTSLVVYGHLVTIRDLIKCPRKKLFGFRNFGQKCMEEIDLWLANHDLHFEQ